MHLHGLGAVVGDQYRMAFLAQEGFKDELIYALVVGDQDAYAAVDVLQHSWGHVHAAALSTQEMTNSFSKWAMSSACRTMPRGLARTRPSLALLVRSRTINSIPRAELST
jgi:hypothetical protein